MQVHVLYFNWLIMGYIWCKRVFKLLRHQFTRTKTLRNKHILTLNHEIMKKKIIGETKTTLTRD